jgi:hypothetical protein
MQRATIPFDPAPRRDCGRPRIAADCHSRSAPVPTRVRACATSTPLPAGDRCVPCGDGTPLRDRPNSLASVRGEGSASRQDIAFPDWGAVALHPQTIGNISAVRKFTVRWLARADCRHHCGDVCGPDRAHRHQRSRSGRALARRCRRASRRCCSPDDAEPGSGRRSGNRGLTPSSVALAQARKLMQPADLADASQLVGSGLAVGVRSCTASFCVSTRPDPHTYPISGPPSSVFRAQ